MSANFFDLMFNPESVAVVGASNALEKWGAAIFARVLISPTVKRPYPINKNSAEVQGVKAYPTVKDLPETPDMVVIAVPYPEALSVVRDCVDKGVKAGIMITAGLGEMGAEGLALQNEIVKVAQKGGLRFTGPNCNGHFNAVTDFSTLRREFRIARGEIGVISQSGGFAGHILMCGIEIGAGFSKFVSVGNEADLHFEDFLEYYGQDEETKVFTGYIEGLRNGRDFFSLAREISNK
ncbi:MAG: CoA-binding protein [Chloroflexi bacterium]|nr:CoA-binding protein [Chloroflexota bacterium]